MTNQLTDQFADTVRGYRLAREHRIQAVEAKIARERLDDVLNSLPALESGFKNVTSRAAAQSKWDAKIWETDVIPALERFDAAALQVDAKAMKAAVTDLAKVLGFSPAFERDEDIIDALANPSVPLVIGKPPERSPEPPPELIARLLGRRERPPSGLDDGEVMRRTRDRRAFAERQGAGVHAFRPGAKGPIYDHHGLQLGDGSVVEFDGELGNLRNARVRRVAFDGFLKDKSSARSVRPTAIRSRKVVTLRPAIACLRALGEVGSHGYRFLSNNCEHLATGSLLGAAHSSQTRIAGQLQRLVDARPELLPILETVIAEDVRIERAPLEPVPSSDGDNPLWYDIGRAFWAPEEQDLIAWLPIWRDGPPPGSADHPWRARALRNGLAMSTWSPIPPAAFLDGAWHASLIAVASDVSGTDRGQLDLFWVLPDGSWHREAASIFGIVERRLRHAQMLVEALGASLVEMLDKHLKALTGRKQAQLRTAETGDG